MRLSKEQFLFLFSEERLFKGESTEISFCIENDPEYTECWLGKMPDPNGGEREIYWCCLKAGSATGYYYDSLSKFLSAQFIRGKSIPEVIHKIRWDSIEGTPFEELLPYYLKEV